MPTPISPTLISSLGAMDLANRGMAKELAQAPAVTAVLMKERLVVRFVVFMVGSFSWCG
jgi:hypothetical protein